MNKFVLYGVVVTLIALIFVFGFRQATIADPTPIQYTEAVLVSEDENSATYSFNFAYSPPAPRGDCDMETERAIYLDVRSKPQREVKLPSYSAGLISTSEKASTVNLYGLYGITNVCGQNEGSVNVDYSNVQADCSITEGPTIEGVKRANINCLFSGNLKPVQDGKVVRAKIAGLTGGSALVTFPKVNGQVITPTNTNIPASTAQDSTPEPSSIVNKISLITKIELFIRGIFSSIVEVFK